MRNLNEVIEAVIAIIPIDADERGETVRRLRQVMLNASYSAPELLYSRWEQASDILTEELGRPNGVEWKERLSRLWTGHY